MKKIGIFGNITVDHYLLNKSYLEEVNKIIKSKGIELRHEVLKQTIPTPEFLEILEEVKRKHIFLKRNGGGGMNSLQAFLHLLYSMPSQNSEISLLYSDLSDHPTIRTNPRIEYQFKKKADLCLALISKIEVNGAPDRKIYKTDRYDKKVKLEESDLEEIANEVKECDVILANSIGNYQVAETTAKNSCGKSKYVVVTKNLTKSELESSRLLAGSTAVIDIDEANILGCNVEYSQENVKNIVEELLSLGAINPIITLGKDGVIFYEHGPRSIHKISTERDLEKKIQSHINSFDISKTGAGDWFVAALAYYHETGGVLEQAIKDSQIFVVKNLFKFKDISEDELRKELVCYRDFFRDENFDEIYDEGGLAVGRASCRR